MRMKEIGPPRSANVIKNTDISGCLWDLLCFSGSLTFFEKLHWE